MSVSSILKHKGSDVVTIRPADTLHDAARTLAKHRIGAVVVLGEAGGVCGILSERDVVAALARGGTAALEKPVQEFMTANVVTCALAETTEDLMEKMTQGRFRHLPVVEGGQLRGIISIGDVVKRRIDDAIHEAQSLKEYIATG
ncbi:MAG TPA: CBS domain-containing protein [Micropepsaceae bacterium]|nr:CBS domain-containing protein [Micropepsaceae bacterium]